MARRGKRGLTEEDRALWKQVAATAKPMDRSGAPAIRDQSTPLAPDLPRHPSKTTPDPIQPFRVGEKTSTSFRSGPETSGSPPIRMDHATYRRMVRGRLKPEGRIDLHGMTLAEAHPALMSFLFEAAEAGKRLVLVITGKGKDRDSGGPIPIRRGILRSQVPAWMAAAPLNALILDIREAHQRHGGGGAFYVYLKRGR